ncbi:uncharacterized protein LOC124441015 [Xenia sp. Carnegie-2017]|uniref:uncharacterized protein LOC124441015 n=1 Tax=Xenia sp. Carnegie-2017 TaxID=2897299 RepID=UPI001F048AF9|nr:uncharacterized protein LOC124441015 [Xenia sp. Carnegie-2017]
MSTYNFLSRLAFPTFRTNFCHKRCSIASLKSPQTLAKSSIQMKGCIFATRRKFTTSSHNSNSHKTIVMVVTSLRVDRVAASGLGIARRKIDHSLLSGNIFLNGEKVTKKSRNVVQGDVIKMIFERQPNKDVIKYGEVKVIEIGDLTKKGNHNIELLRNKSLSMSTHEFWEHTKSKDVINFST